MIDVGIGRVEFGWRSVTLSPTWPTCPSTRLLGYATASLARRPDPTMPCGSSIQGSHRKGIGRHCGEAARRPSACSTRLNGRAYRCKPIAARGGLASAGVVLSSELDGARGSKVYTMEGLCVATSDEPTAFYASDGSTVEARRALAKHAARTAAAAGGAERSGPRP